MKLIRSHFNGKLWHELTAEEHRDFPGDYEAQVSQGAITFHSEEHLVTSDRGIGMLRRQLRQQLQTLAEGRDPIGTHFSEQQALVRLRAGTEVVDAADD